MRYLPYAAFCIVIISMLFVGCSDNKYSYDFSEDTSATEQGEFETVPVNIMPLDVDEACDVLNSCSNFYVSQNLNINVPQTAMLFEYTTTTPMNQDFESYYTEYCEIFKYLFPNRELKEDYLLYLGGSSKLEYGDDGSIVQDFHKVKDYYDILVSGEEGQVSLLYDETWYRDMIEWKTPVCFEIGSHIGYGYTIINKGKTVEQTSAKVYDELLGAERYPILESYDPIDWLECIGTYMPDSTQQFQLLDKEVAICDAVSFFEEYINSIPYPSESNMETSVLEVDVLKVDESTYGFYFLTTKSYQGIPFDHMRSGTMHSEFSDYVTTGGNAFMIESNDVDIIYGYYQLQLMEDIIPCQEIVSFEVAAQTISSSLSDNVEFEVEKVEVVYTEKPNKTDEGYIDMNNYSSEVAPAWKFTLYNSNDNVHYVCYVDAKDGENFRYYKTSNGVDDE